MSRCRWCGRILVQAARGRPKRYCSPACKQAAYRRRCRGRAVNPGWDDAERWADRLRQRAAAVIEPALRKCISR